MFVPVTVVAAGTDAMDIGSCLLLHLDFDSIRNIVI